MADRKLLEGAVVTAPVEDDRDWNECMDILRRGQYKTASETCRALLAWRNKAIVAELQWLLDHKLLSIEGRAINPGIGTMLGSDWNYVVPKKAIEDRLTQLNEL